jgi:hypothetical protein
MVVIMTIVLFSLFLIGAIMMIKRSKGSVKSKSGNDNINGKIYRPDGYAPKQPISVKYETKFKPNTKPNYNNTQSSDDDILNTVATIYMVDQIVNHHSSDEYPSDYNSQSSYDSGSGYDSGGSSYDSGSDSSDW